MTRWCEQVWISEGGPPLRALITSVEADGTIRLLAPEFAHPMAVLEVDFHAQPDGDHVRTRQQHATAPVRVGDIVRATDGELTCLAVVEIVEHDSLILRLLLQTGADMLGEPPAHAGGHDPTREPFSCLLASLTELAHARLTDTQVRAAYAHGHARSRQRPFQQHRHSRRRRR